METATKFKPKVALVGSVGSSRRTLSALIRHGLPIVGVLGLNPLKSSKVSGYCRLDDLALSAGVPYFDFEKINHSNVLSIVQQWSPDILFVVGLSQIVRWDLLSIPKLGCVGFHPTWLPEGRGRAPVAWLTLEGRPGAATFFLMDEGADSGPILIQEPFFVSNQDYAGDVVEKIESAIDVALDRWLPCLAAGRWEPVSQQHELGTYYGRRSPEDGFIQWEWSAQQIQSLVRAASDPHPGAYTYADHRKLIIWRAEVDLHTPYRGVTGRILEGDQSRGWLVQTGDGLIRLTEVEFPLPSRNDVSSVLRVGMRLGYNSQDEVYQINQHIVRLEQRLATLERLLANDARSNQ